MTFLTAVFTVLPLCLVIFYLCISKALNMGGHSDLWAGISLTSAIAAVSWIIVEIVSNQTIDWAVLLLLVSLFAIKWPERNNVVVIPDGAELPKKGWFKGVLSLLGILVAFTFSVDKIEATVKKSFGPPIDTKSVVTDKKVYSKSKDGSIKFTAVIDRNRLCEYQSYSSWRYTNGQLAYRYDTVHSTGRSIGENKTIKFEKSLENVPTGQLYYDSVIYYLDCPDPKVPVSLRRIFIEVVD